MTNEVLVYMPLHLNSKLLRAVRYNPMTSFESKDDMNEHIGWLICAYEILVDAHMKESHGIDYGLVDNKG